MTAPTDILGVYVQLAGGARQHDGSVVVYSATSQAHGKAAKIATAMRLDSRSERGRLPMRRLVVTERPGGRVA